MYVTRLLEVLQNEFPGLLAYFGDNEFDKLAKSFISKHPTKEKLMRDYPQAFVPYLQEHSSQLAYELAHFEWLMTEAADSADATVVTRDELVALPQK